MFHTVAVAVTVADAVTTVLRIYMINIIVYKKIHKKHYFRN